MVLQRSRRNLAFAPALAVILLGTVGAPDDRDVASDRDGASDALPTPQVVTLVTGDRLLVTQVPGGRQAVAVEAADRNTHVSFTTTEYDGQLYITPSDAELLIPETLDRELFNVTKLLDYGYTNGVPVIVTYDDTADPAMKGTTGNRVPGAAPNASPRALPSINAIATTIGPGVRWWRGVQSPPVGVTAANGPLAGVEKVWLDELTEVTLDESVPQIGAPDAWDAGYDGTGVTVAVLDTGIDLNHPDLAGKIGQTANFTNEPDVTDQNGHGTHVASTVAGQGTASDGRYTGVAPGAELMVGKVCIASGGCASSWIIDGMEWAAEQGADLVNISIGGPATDGTDPISAAVNTLTAAHDVLFAISAGNDGPADHTVTRPGAADAALTVGAVNKDDQLARFSSRGPRVGDFALKPDVTAPGVGIVAARADGTSLGAPVDSDYTRASGTSMAAPHAAGAAAILLQQDPALGPAELKAALSTTAVPHPDLDVYQQGGGRIHIPSALNAPVRANQAPLDLGYFAYPHDDAQPVARDVTFTNRTDEPVTLDVALDVVGQNGQVPAAGMLSVQPATVTVPARGTADVTVTVDVSAGEVGLYGGYLVAQQDGQPVSRVPVGFYKESERYTLTVEGITRTGDAAGGSSRVDVFNVSDLDIVNEFLVRFTDGTATFRVPPGVYSVTADIYTYDPPEMLTRAQSVATVGDPEVEITGDTTVVLDGRDATRIAVDTPEHETAPFHQNRIGWSRVTEAGQVKHWSRMIGDLTCLPRYATPTEEVTRGELEFYSYFRLGEPEVELTVTDPVELELHPCLMGLSQPRRDVDESFRLVDVGLGNPEDFAGVDVEGAIVLARAGGPVPQLVEREAAGAGAVAVLIANDKPGQLHRLFSNEDGIPTMGIPRQEGDALIDRLAEDEVTVAMHSIASSPYVYDVIFPEPGRVPADLNYRVETGELATVEASYHSDVAGRLIGDTRFFFRKGAPTATSTIAFRSGPFARTEYITADDTEWGTRFYPDRSILQPAISAPWGPYEPGQHLEESWNQGPATPTTVDPAFVDPVQRLGDTLDIVLAEWSDAHPDHWQPMSPTADTAAFRIYQDGELVAEAARPRGSFPLSPSPATYRLELDVARDADWWTTSTATHTAWTIHSAGTVEGAQPWPLLLIDYDAELDLLNTAAHPRDRRGPSTVGLAVRHQPGTDGPPVVGARAWVSYDDGDTWRSRPTRQVGDGRFEVILDSRDPAETTGYLSLRVEAWDADGNRIEQEIIRAFALPQR